LQADACGILLLKASRQVNNFAQINRNGCLFLLSHFLFLNNVPNRQQAVFTSRIYYAFLIASFIISASLPAFAD
jgi:hypothetical protein